MDIRLASTDDVGRDVTPRVPEGFVAGEAAKGIAHDLEEAMSLIGRWVECAPSASPYQSGQVITGPDPGQGWLVDEQGSTHPRFLVNLFQRGITTTIQGSGITRAELASVLAHVGSGRGPGLPWDLLISSRRLLDGENPAVAIVQAATAVEVAAKSRLTRGLSEHVGDAALSGAINDQLDRLTLGRLLRFLQSANLLGGVAQSVWETSVVGLRNRVVHDGYEATAPEAREALKAARELVECLDPTVVDWPNDPRPEDASD